MKRIIAGLAAIASSTLPALADEHRVIIDAMQFRPAVLDVAMGDTVVFVNADSVPHTATAIARGLDRGRDGGGAFVTGIIAPGQSHRLVMRRSGEIDFTCDHHPHMRGRIVAN